MNQTYANMLSKVKEFHDKHEFSKKENNGHDMSYRILLTIEELGELSECFTKGKTDSEKAEELADLLILIIGHAIAMKVNLETAFDKKMKKIMKRPAIMGDLGIRVTDYKNK
jgi:NTP pyrophosphatase (non-canonical NTP hydrolase)